MTGFLRTLINDYHDHVTRQKNLPFLEGVMAACALVASADGEITFGERVRVDQILETLDALKVFDPHQGVNIFNNFTDKILVHPREGHEKAFQAMKRVAIVAENGALMLRICCAVSEGNGEKSLVDQIEIVTLCSRLGIDPRDCDLYTSEGLDGTANSPGN